MTKIAHFSDLHIRPLKYMDEMEFTISAFIESIIENKVDFVVFCGDFFHSKLTVSNEYFDIATSFLKRLSDVCPVVMIPGNHDAALTNHGRMDALSPIVKAISPKHPIYFSKYTEIIHVDLFSFYHFSVFDKKEKWEKLRDGAETGVLANPACINICLYHGSINASKVDSGWVSHGNEDDITIFDGFDAAFLGDIHKSQFLTKTIAYPGSTRQNNFGEDIEKGYILWNVSVDNKSGLKKIKGEKVTLPQKRYFFTLFANDVSDLPDMEDFPKDCRYRIKLTKDVDLVTESLIREKIVKEASPHGEIFFIPPDEDLSAIKVTKVGNMEILHENIRDQEIQKNLITEFLKKKNCTEEEIEKVIALDSVYHSYIDIDVSRNVEYKIKTMKWSNMFSYGKDNEINFEKMNGLIGIFGSNGTGKSSCFDTLIFGLENGIFREGANKNGDYVNRKCKNAEVSLKIEMNEKTYLIDRKIKKVYSKDKEDPKVDNDVDFYMLPKKKESSLNGETKPDTNREIRNAFGTKEDFEITSYCPQFGLTRFIDNRGTERKKSLAKFFDLEVFDVKYEKATEDYKELKNSLKAKNKTELLKKKEVHISELSALNFSKDELQLRVAEIEKEIERNDELIDEITASQQAIVEIDIQKVRKSLTNAEAQCEACLDFIDKKENEIKKSKFSGKTIKEVDELSGYELDAVANLKSKISNYIKKIDLLTKIPNVAACRTCVFAKDAYEAKDDLIKQQDLLKKAEAEEAFGKEAFKILETMNDLEEVHAKLKNWVKTVDELEAQITQYELSKDIIEKNIQIKKEIQEEKQVRAANKSKLADLKSDLMQAWKDISRIETLIEVIDRDVLVGEEVAEKTKIYQLYLDAVGKNGISYWIISKKLILINKLVNQILSTVVQFKFSIEDSDEDKSIKLYIIDDKKGKRPAELASGGEKTLISLALRAALWKLCLLPKTSILILDESLSFLDNERYDAVLKLLKYLNKDYFDKIFIITHDEELKKEMDSSIYIEEKNGYSVCRT